MRGILRRRRADQNVAHIPSRDRIKQPARARLSATLALGQRHRRAEPRQPGIEHDQIAEPDADAAEAHGEARRLAFRQNQYRARLAQTSAQTAHTNPV